MSCTVPGGVAALTASRDREKAHAQPGISGLRYSGALAGQKKGKEEKKRKHQSGKNGWNVDELRSETIFASSTLFALF